MVTAGLGGNARGTSKYHQDIDPLGDPDLVEKCCHGA